MVRDIPIANGAQVNNAWQCRPQRLCLESMTTHSSIKRAKKGRSGLAGLVLAGVLLCAFFVVSNSQEALTDSSQVTPIEKPLTQLEFRSDPSGATFIVDETPLSDSALNYAVVDSGEHTVEAYLEGFEPLSYTFSCTYSERISFNFILASLPPQPQPGESLGLSILPIKSFVDSTRADQKMKSYRGAAEFFAIFPLTQGVMTKLFLGDERGDEGTVMIASGAVLTAGSLLLGKILSTRQRKSIREQNERILSENEEASLHNRNIEQALRESERKRVAAWETENLRRGRVSVVRR